MGTDLENDGRSIHRLGIAWILFCCALALHVTDEALTGFLSVYNPTVLALRQQLGFWPMPTFTFQLWLTLLIMGILVLLTLSPLFFRNVPWVRPVAYFCAVVVGIFNAVGHTVATIFGQTVSSVTFPRPAPGFYSSPFLFATACFLLVQLRRTGSGLQTLS
jgi:hypothetical protein